MGNELTPQSPKPYPIKRNSMDENGEVKKEGQEGAENQAQSPQPASNERVERARKAWEEHNKKEAEEGKTLTPRQIEAQRRMSERGILPQGTKDPRFESFDPEKFKDNQSLYELAKELKAYDDVTQDRLDEIKERLNRLTALGGVSDDQHDQFISDINEAVETSKLRGSLSASPTISSPEGSASSGITVYSQFDTGKFKGTPLEGIAERIKKVGLGSGESMQAIATDYGLIKDSLPGELQDEYNREIVRVQGLATVTPETGRNASEKYKDKPVLFEIMRELEGLKTLGRLNNQEMNRVLRPLIQMVRNEEISQPEVEAFMKDVNELAGIKEAAAREERISRNNVRSIQEVAKIIITDEGEDRWGPIDGVPVGTKSDAPFPLLEQIPGSDQLRINKANFVRWARDRAMYHHLNNSRDMQLQITRLVGIVNEFGSTTSIYSMDENRGRFFKDAETGKVLDDLADQLKTEIWLFGNMRNYDLIYREYMGQDSKLPEFLVNVHNKEELTISDSMERIMTLSEAFLGDDASKENPQDMKVGDAARKAYEIYYYMSDLGKLREILGENSIFFKKEGLINVFKILEKKAHTDEISKVNMDKVNELFDGDKIKEAAFIEFINPFNNQNKPDYTISVARELVKQAVAEKYGLEYGLEKSIKEERTASGKYRAPERTFLRLSADYAETWAWIMSRFTGAAARNDTQSVGFDAFTKTMQFMRYRVRQSRETRAGQFGNEYNLGVFKQLTLDFFNGVWVQQGYNEKTRKTPFELMMELDVKDREIEKIRGTKKEEDLTLDERAKIKEIEDVKREIAHKFRFDQSTQKGYATNHLGRAFEIFHNMLGNEELRLDQIVKWEPYLGGTQGRYVIDRTKFEEAFKEKFVKPVRYAFSTYPMIDFGKEVRELVDTGTNDKLPEYKTTNIAEAIFGPIVINSLKREMIHIKKEKIKEKMHKNKEHGKPKDAGLSDREKEIWKKKRWSDDDKRVLWKEMITGQNADLRPLLWKRAVMARIARDLLSHRQRSQNNKYEYFGHEQIELFLNALESIPSIDMEASNDNEELVFKYGEKFLNEEDIEWIRRESETTEGHIFRKDITPSILGGFAKGIGEGFKDFFKGSFK